VVRLPAWAEFSSSSGLRRTLHVLVARAVTPVVLWLGLQGHHSHPFSATVTTQLRCTSPRSCTAGQVGLQRFAAVYCFHLEHFDPEGGGSMLLRNVAGPPSNSMNLPSYKFRFVILVS